MAPNHLRRMGSLSSFKRPNFPVRKMASTFPRPHRIVSASEHSRLHSRTSGKTGGGKGTRPTFSRFLQPSLSGTKEERLLETGHRSQSVQHLSTEAYLQNGNTAIHPESWPMHWGVSLDLEDAFCPVPIHPNFRKYLRFAFQGQVYKFQAMPFGLAIAPRVFTKLMAAVGAHLRVHRVLLLQYFDDWLLHQLHRQLLLWNLVFAWKELLSLGHLLNANKSDLIPSQDFTFLGMNFLTHLNQVRVSRQQVSDLIARVKWVLTQSHITAQDSVANFVLLGRLFLRPLQHYLSSLWVWSPGNLMARIPILPPLVPHLQWWLVKETLLAGVPLLPSQPSLHLITDASKEGMGAHLEPLSLTVSGMWSPQESLMHINNLEMRAAGLAVTNFQSHLQDSCVMLSTDKTSVVSYVQARGGTHSHSLYLETRYLLVLCRIWTFLFQSNIYQVASMPWQTVCLENTSYFLLSGLSFRKWPTKSFSL